jgi:hypothetical protein
MARRRFPAGPADHCSWMVGDRSPTAAGVPEPGRIPGQQIRDTVSGREHHQRDRLARERRLLPCRRRARLGDAPKVEPPAGAELHR